MLQKGAGGSVIQSEASTSFAGGSDANAGNDNFDVDNDSIVDAPAPVKGLSGVQNQVLAYIRSLSQNTESGPRIGDILQELAKKGLSEKQVREAIEYLSNEGHIY